MLRDTIVNTQQLSQNHNGLLMFYDNSRLRWISTSRELVSFGIGYKDLHTARWMQVIGGVNTNISGYKLVRDGLITSLTVQTQTLTTCDFVIRKNGNPSNIHTLSLINELSKVNDNMNIDLNENDWLQVLLVVPDGYRVNYPVLNLEIAWR